LFARNSIFREARKGKKQKDTSEKKIARRKTEIVNSVETKKISV